jgi:Retinal pigment epithelial membrane protein
VSEFTSKTTETTMNNADRTTPPRSPKAVLSVSREEFYGQDSEHQPLELIVKEGMSENACQLPDDLQGHIFIIGAAGSVDSPKCQGSTYIVEPSQDGWTHLFNGEGIIYRLDFNETPQITNDNLTGKAWMTTRIVKTPDHYADIALHDNPKYQQQWPQEYPLLKFRNFGITRLSVKLGTRNYLNTAWLPMKFSDGSERLCVTWDAGRPYEIDPRTLGLVGPIGWNSQWYPITELAPKGPFPPLLSAAHPVFDTHTDEMFTVNGSKSMQTVFWIARLLTFDAKEFADRFLKLPILKWLFKKLVQGCIVILKFLIGLLEFFGIGGSDVVYLNRWMGSGTAIEQWSVVEEHGVWPFKIKRPLKIQQSLHQMGLSKDYILLSDSAFKLPFEDLLPHLNPKNPLLEDLEDKLLPVIREYLSYPELPYTRIYIIPRHQLKTGAKTVTAKRVTIAPETAHFLVEYDNSDDNSDDKIVLYVAHTAASDPAEFIHGSDESYYDDPQLNQDLKTRSGMVVNGMDVSRFGRWVIDAKKAKCESPVFISKADSQQYLWSLSIYAWKGFQPDRFTDIYWNCWGSWPELLSQFIFEMYDNYKPRWVPLKEMVDEVVKNGKPSNLIRTHIDCSSSTQLTIEDAYDFPPGYFGNSPQFVPRSNTDDPTDGYLVCIVIHSDNLLSDKCELWVFDAKSLKSGPKYRLSHPQLNMGVTIHTTWLSKLETPPVREDYDVRKDYQDAVAQTGSEAVTTLFEEDVYPHFESGLK